jgi:hypothetical protein
MSIKKKGKGAGRITGKSLLSLDSLIRNTIALASSPGSSAEIGLQNKTA